MLDVFRSDLFSVVNLTDAINTPKFQPRRLQSLGIFQETPVTTTTVVIEEKAGQLALVSPTPRGGPGQTLDKSQRAGRAMIVPHFEINDGVMAEEVQGVRAFGTEDTVASLQDLISERMMLHRNSHEATIEYSRIGAVQGVITYADASSVNLFTEFGVSAEDEIDFDLDAGSPAAGVLRGKCATVIRKMGATLEGVPFTGVHALCGDNFFDLLLAHSEVRNTFLNNPTADQLRQSYIGPNGEVWGSFYFGGIWWENYRGAVGNTAFVNSDKCHLFPIGVPGLFRTYFAPADYVETVNTRGLRLYAKQYPMDNGKGVKLDTQTNTLSLCTRPRVLIKGKKT